MIRFKPTSLKEKNAKEQVNVRLKEAVEMLENALCEMDEVNAERFATIENALCDIDLTGGNKV